ncbi:hypothetical protein [Bradyrhizobium sp. 1]|uniref:hypothetical protein n=1 Tax=Bradyrhizobium sp. 1 TaxID=241591 RepID=UPI001FFAB342|nr:hypothetical protein [Bradyrhizobium sp. 1]MCK1393942.1 hypothetical protein [Bradyrhizobium sp. 1]
MFRTVIFAASALFLTTSISLAASTNNGGHVVGNPKSVASPKSAAGDCNWDKAKLDIDFSVTDNNAKICVREKMTTKGGKNFVTAVSLCNKAMDHQNFNNCIRTGQVCQYDLELKPPWTPCQ